MRFSLRELVVLPAVFAVAALALYFANPVVSGVTVMTVVLTLLAMLARVFALNGDRWVYAMTFLCAALAYVAVLLAPLANNKSTDFRGTNRNPFIASLPTTRAMTPLLSALTERKSIWLNETTGRRSSKPPAGSQTFYRSGFAFAMDAGGSRWRMVLDPPYAEFMTVGHSLWTLLFGWLAGKHAVWLFRLRMASEGSTARSGG